MQNSQRVLAQDGLEGCTTRALFCIKHLIIRSHMGPLIFNLSCLWVTRWASRSGHLILGTAPGTHCMVGCVGPRAVLDALEKR